MIQNDGEFIRSSEFYKEWQRNYMYKLLWFKMTEILFAAQFVMKNDGELKSFTVYDSKWRRTLTYSQFVIKNDEEISCISVRAWFFIYIDVKAVTIQNDGELIRHSVRDKELEYPFGIQMNGERIPSSVREKEWRRNNLHIRSRFKLKENLFGAQFLKNDGEITRIAFHHSKWNKMYLQLSSW